MIISVCCNKGGSGKTTSATALASALANLEPVLLADLDSQSHVTLFYGLPVRSGLYDYFVRDLPLSNCTLTGRPALLTILPGDSHTKTVERVFSGERRGDELVARLRDLPGEYVILDTPPGGYMQEMAIKAADMLVIPFRPEAAGVAGVYDTLKLARALRHDLEHDGMVTLLPTAFDVRIKDQRERLANLIVEYGSAYGLEPVDDVRQARYAVRLRAAVAEAPAYGLTIWEHSADGIEIVRVAYSILAARVLALAARERIEETERQNGNS